MCGQVHRQLAELSGYRARQLSSLEHHRSLLSTPCSNRIDGMADVSSAEDDRRCKPIDNDRIAALWFNERSMNAHICRSSTKAFGVVGLNSNRLVTLDTQFAIGSITNGNLCPIKTQKP